MRDGVRRAGGLIVDDRQARVVLRAAEAEPFTEWWVDERVTPLPVQHAPGFALRAAEQTRAALWRRAVGDEMTPTMLAMLVALRNSPGISQRVVADLIGSDKATTATVVRQLRERGMLQAVPDGQDMRRNRLRLEAGVDPVIDRDLERAYAVDDALLAALESQEREAVHRLWSLAADASRAVADGPAFLNSAGAMLRRARQRHSRAWDREAGQFTPGQFASLVVLYFNGELDVTTTARLASLEDSTGARLLLGLGRRGVIARRRDPRDRRRILLSLTESGTREMMRATPGVGRVQAEITGALDERERREFHVLTSRVARLR